MTDEGEENLPSSPQVQAKEFVDKLPHDLLIEISPLAHIEIQLHKGTDFYGQRISPKARAVLHRTAAYLKGKIVASHNLKTPEDLDEFYKRTGLANPHVVNDLSRRYQTQQEEARLNESQK